jgi:hypothetical protein
MGLGPRFCGFGRAKKGCGKPHAGWQEHCYFIAPHFRTLFGICEMLLPERGGGAKGR